MKTSTLVRNLNPDDASNVVRLMLRKEVSGRKRRSEDENVDEKGRK